MEGPQEGFVEAILPLKMWRLNELKHSRTIMDYVKEFFNLMLQIENISKEDLLFNFMDGL